MGLFDAIASSAANLTDNVVGMVNQNHQNKVNLRMMRNRTRLMQNRLRFNVIGSNRCGV